MKYYIMYNGTQVGPMEPQQLLAYGLFAILLGGLGIRYFYVGKIAGGLICILLTFVTCGIWSIVSLIQGILMITMSDSEFESKYVTSPSTFPLF